MDGTPSMVNKFHISYHEIVPLVQICSLQILLQVLYQVTPNPKITLVDCVTLTVNTLIRNISILDKFLSSCRVCVELNTRFTAISCRLSGPKRTHPLWCD